MLAETRKNRQEVQISMKSVRKGCRQMSMEGRIWEREVLRLERKNDVVMNDKGGYDDTGEVGH